VKIVRKDYADPPLNPAYHPGRRGVPAWLEEYRLKLRYGWFYLMCGHGTDIQIQERYGVFRPRKVKDKYWCEECGSWVKKLPPPPASKIPDEPMF
jgi:hypothetical protein